MSAWISINVAPPPVGSHVLLWFAALRHAEDAQIHQDDGDWYYVLFDGESFNSPPTHWAPFSEPQP